MIEKNYAGLLSRPEWSFDDAAIDAALSGKRVLITGAGGSIGSALALRVSKSPAAFLGVVGHSEISIHNLLPHLSGSSVPVGHAIMDVGSASMSVPLSDWKPDIIFHAAAHKHVSLMEKQPAEAFKNNVEATIHLSLLARSYNVGKFVFISTDKAVSPTSVMGASKKLAEAWLMTDIPRDHTVCRFGNVLGSSGSLVEILERRVAEGKNFQLTAPGMKRFCITAKEAVGLVLTSGLLFPPGLYTLEMGAPVRIEDIAARISPSTPIEFTNPGPGEKFDEDLIAPGEERSRTDHPGIYAISNPDLFGARVRWLINSVRENPEKLKEVVQDL